MSDKKVLFKGGTIMTLAAGSPFGSTFVGDVLIEGIQHDMARIAAGAPLPALGEGSVCDYCAVRGLCRKDMWADAEQALPAQQTP